MSNIEPIVQEVERDQNGWLGATEEHPALSTEASWLVLESYWLSFDCNLDMRSRRWSSSFCPFVKLEPHDQE